MRECTITFAQRYEKEKEGKKVSYYKFQYSPIGGGFAETALCSDRYAEQLDRYVKQKTPVYVCYDRNFEGKAQFAGFVEVRK